MLKLPNFFVNIFVTDWFNFIWLILEFDFCRRIPNIILGDVVDFFGFERC